MSRTYSVREVESSVAFGVGLHGHRRFDEFVAQHEDLLGAKERITWCIKVAAELEAAVDRLSVVWGESHDYYLVIEALVDEVIERSDLDVDRAIESAVNRCKTNAS